MYKYFALTGYLIIIICAMWLRRKSPNNYPVNYQVMMEPELKQRLVELKTFHNIDVPEHVRQLLREWVKIVEEKLRSEI